MVRHIRASAVDDVWTCYDDRLSPAVKFRAMTTGVAI